MASQAASSHLVTKTQTWSSPSPSMAARMGRPAVPPGSPSSALRVSPATLYAQQLCEAPESLAASTCASAYEGVSSSLRRTRGVPHASLRHTRGVPHAGLWHHAECLLVAG